MPRYLYIAWFRNLAAHADDEDREWPACFVIEAASESDALRWGDHLAKRYAGRHGAESFSGSSVEPASEAKGDLSRLPVVKCGQEASDEAIGW